MSYNLWFANCQSMGSPLLCISRSSFFYSAFKCVCVGRKDLVTSKICIWRIAVDAGSKSSKGIKHDSMLNYFNISIRMLHIVGTSTLEMMKNCHLLPKIKF